MLLWPINLVYLVPLAAGMGAWLLIDRPGRARDVTASALVATALMSFALGVPVALGILTRLVLDRSLRRRAWIAALPLGLFAVWYLTFWPGQPLAADERQPVEPARRARLHVGHGGGGSGRTHGVGRALQADRHRAARYRRAGTGLSLRALPWLGRGARGAAVLRGLTALSRADIGYPASSRYIYPSVVFVLLVLCQLPAATGRRLGGHPAATRGAGDRGRPGGRGRGRQRRRAAKRRTLPAQRGRQHRARPCGAEVGRGEIDPAHRPQPRYAPQVSAGQYLEAVRDLGSALPGGLTAQLRDQSQAITIDTRLWVAEEIGLRPAASGEPAGRSAPEVELAIMGRARARGGCIEFVPTGHRPRWMCACPPGAAWWCPTRARADGHAPAALLPILLHRAGVRCGRAPLATLGDRARRRQPRAVGGAHLRAGPGAVVLDLTRPLSGARPS